MKTIILLAICFLALYKAEESTPDESTEETNDEESVEETNDEESSVETCEEGTF